jgi:hypothetical protein
MITYIILSIIVGTAIEVKVKRDSGTSLSELISMMVALEQPEFSDDEHLVATHLLHAMMYILFPITALMLIK